MAKVIVAVKGLDDESIITLMNRSLKEVYPVWVDNKYIVRVDATHYRVKSLSRDKWHEVDISEPAHCECEHYEFNPGTRKACIHVKLAVLHDTGYRKPKYKTNGEATCVRCSRRFRRIYTVEVHDISHPAYYPGDRLCLPCSDIEGVQH